jgi:hypothetical protein
MMAVPAKGFGENDAQPASYRPEYRQADHDAQKEGHRYGQPAALTGLL